MGKQLTPEEIEKLEVIEENKARKQAEKQEAQARKEAQKLEAQKNASGNKNSVG